MSRQQWVLRSVSLGTLVFLYMPIVVLILFSFNASRMAATWEGVTLDWYRQLALDEDLWLATRNSLVVGGVSTLVALGLGVSAGVMMERRRFWGRRFLDGAFLLPLVIPEVMMGVGLLLLFVMVQWPLGLSTVILGHILFNLPLVMVIVRARLRRLDPVLEEAARDLGATPWQAFRRVTLPLLRPAILGAGLMAFTISLDDFVVTFFTAGPGSTTLPLKVFSMVRTGVSPEINALSAILVILSMGLIGVALVFQRK